MGKHDKVLAQVLSGAADANISFDDLRRLLLRLGFVERQRGRPRIMWQDEIVEEVRRVRDEYAARFNYDIDAICADIEEKQRRSGRQYVSLNLENGPLPGPSARAGQLEETTIS